MRLFTASQTSSSPSPARASPFASRPIKARLTSSCVGQSANTNDSGIIPCEPGLDCTECKLGSRTCSRIRLRRQRLDDRSRMNREVHVRFSEGLAVRFRWATQLPALRSVLLGDDYDARRAVGGGTERCGIVNAPDFEAGVHQPSPRFRGRISTFLVHLQV